MELRNRLVLYDRPDAMSRIYEMATPKLSEHDVSFVKALGSMTAENRSQTKPNRSQIWLTFQCPVDRVANHAHRGEGISYANS